MLEDLFEVKTALGLQRLQPQLVVLMVTYQAYSSSNLLPNLNGERTQVREYESLVDEVAEILPIVMKEVRSFVGCNLVELYHCICHALAK